MADGNSLYISDEVTEATAGGHATVFSGITLLSSKVLCCSRNGESVFTSSGRISTWNTNLLLLCFLFDAQVKLEDVWGDRGCRPSTKGKGHRKGKGHVLRTWHSATPVASSLVWTDANVLLVWDLIYLLRVGSVQSIGFIVLFCAVLVPMMWNGICRILSGQHFFTMARSI